MKEVIAIIRPEKWQATMDAISELDADQICQYRVSGRGKQRGLRYLRPITGEEVGVMPFLPKRMASWFVEEADVDAFVAAIIKVNQADNFGDGKIFVCPLDEVEVIDAARVFETAVV
jgi:nitrogen regulatory protein PII 2